MRKLTVGIAVGVLVFTVLLSVTGFAQSRPASKPAAVAGTYEGWARGSSQGDLSTTVILEQQGSSLTGTMAAGPFSFALSEGKVDGENLSWSFSDGNVSGTVTASYTAGAIRGSWWAANGETGALELKRS
jgi:hypothetical protein